MNFFRKELKRLFVSVLNRHRFDADPNHTFHFDADPDPDSDPDPTSSHT